MNLDQVNALKVGDSVAYRPRPFARKVAGHVVSPGLPITVRRGKPNSKHELQLVEWWQIESV